MTRPSFLRHAGWVSPEDFTEKINIIGCGAVGSNLALTLAKMGATQFELWDLDVVEAHNLPNQAFELKHIAQPKVEALKEVLTRFNPDITCNVHQSFFTTENKKDLEGVVVIATDSMKSRAEIYETFYVNPLVEHVFEIRLGFDYGELNIVDNMNPTQCENWRKLIISDDEVPDGPCNQRICTTLVQIISSYAVHMICDKFVCMRKEEDWFYNSKTMIELNPILKVYQLK